jgi:hypothetical protein
MVSPAEWFGFPPALCPIWSDASLPYYLGYWKHWFSSRPASFVTMYVRSGRKVREIARTPDQLFCHAIMAAIVVHDGVTPAIERFSSAVGITDLSEIDKVSLKTGDDPLGYSAIPQFKTDTPLASATTPAQYTGTFPTGDFSSSVEWWRDACSFEVSEDVLTAWPNHIAKPLWLRPGPKAPVFDDLLRADDLHGAWLTLSSTGWSVLQAKRALRQLADKANDRVFSLLVAAWTDIADEQPGNSYY